MPPEQRSLPATPDGSAQEHHARRALSDVKGHLQRSALKLVAYLLAAYVVLKLVPALKQAFRSLEHVSWEWLLGAIALEVCSELGFVLAWGQVVDQRSCSIVTAAGGEPTKMSPGRSSPADCCYLAGRGEGWEWEL